MIKENEFEYIHKEAIKMAKLKYHDMLKEIASKFRFLHEDFHGVFIQEVMVFMMLELTLSFYPEDERLRYLYDIYKRIEEAVLSHKYSH